MGEMRGLSLISVAPREREIFWAASRSCSAKMRRVAQVSYDRLGGSSSVDLFELGWTLASEEGAGLRIPLGDEPDSQQSGST